MKKNSLIFALMIIFLLPVSSGATTDFNALDYLPPNNFVGGYEANGNELFGKPGDVAYILGKDYYLLNEYGLVWYASETYSNRQDEITIEIFEFPSPSDAFGYYSMSPIPYVEPDPTTGIVVEPYGLPPVAKIDSLRNISNQFLEGYKDRFYFRIFKQDFTEELTRICVYMLTNLPGEAMPASMLSILPTSNRVMGTERYIRGAEGLNLLIQGSGDDILGFGQYSWKAVAAEYRLGSGEYYLQLIAEYDDSEAASDVASRMLAYFNDKRWQTVMVSPLPSGVRPRAFSSGKYIAFWNNNNKIYLLWDLSSQDKLVSALQRW